MEEAIADMVLAELGIENLRPATAAELLGVKDLDIVEAKSLMMRCLPRFSGVGFPDCDETLLEDFTCKAIAALWGGMGAVYEITAKVAGCPDVSIMAKHVDLFRGGSGKDDARRRASYLCEMAFYSRGHAECLLKAGCFVPLPLLIDISHDQRVWICMTKLVGEKARLGLAETLAVVRSLARMHAIYWGCRADDQEDQEHLDAQEDQHMKMPKNGWEGRLRLAAHAIDQRLKADKMQTVIHGDAKVDNMIFTRESGHISVSFCDFQYCGKAVATKDIAYVLSCATSVPEEENELLEAYLVELSNIMLSQGDIPPTIDEVSQALDLSICDLGRWMSGWGWWGNPIKDRIERVLDKLDDGALLDSEEAYVVAVWEHYPCR